MARALYPGSPFERVAAATELHYCASTSSVGLPPDWSRCAEHYFRSVLELVSPIVIFAVGAHVEKTLRRQFGAGGPDGCVKWPTGEAPVIALPHPNSRGPKRRPFDMAVAQARHHLQTRATAQKAGAQPAEQCPATRPAEQPWARPIHDIDTSNIMVLIEPRLRGEEVVDFTLVPPGVAHAEAPRPRPFIAISSETNARCRFCAAEIPDRRASAYFARCSKCNRPTDRRV